MIPIKGIRIIHLSNRIILQNVLCISIFQCNFNSVQKLTEDMNCSLTFVADLCVLQDLLSRTQIRIGRLYRGLYLFELMAKVGVAMHVSKDSAKIWHSWLGHPSCEKLEYVHHLCKTILLGHNTFCDTCIRAKQTRPSFSHSSIKPECCFVLIHCDIQGPYKTSSLTAHYFLSIVDNYSRGVQVYLMRYKSNAAKYVKFFCNMTETQFGKRVQRLCIDNGAKFHSPEMIRFYQQKGILLQSSCPYTPQQNSVVERKHRYILDTARTLLFHSSMPTQFQESTYEQPCILSIDYQLK